ncbi:MAG TPA: LpxD N-terminal domain-containing protein, partial [Xanthomonadaceae bacterium]|nr:LpxD N-terminal domain-containing protein [Xanthomonadaceae bacterium]
MSTTAHTLAQLAERFDLGLRGDVGIVIQGVATLAHAGEGQLAFLANAHYRSELATTRASAVVLHASDAEDSPVACLVAANPQAAFARIAALYDPRTPPAPGIHPSAAIDPTARIDPGANIGAFVSIGPRSVVAAG